MENLWCRYLAKILALEGSKDIAVGQPIAIIVEDPGDIGSVKNSVTSGTEINGEKKPTMILKMMLRSFTKISPSAKLLIPEHGLDASSLQASGPYGTLLKGDVLAAIKSEKASSRSSSHTEKTSPSFHPQTSPAVSQGSNLELSDSFEDLPNTQIRKLYLVLRPKKGICMKHKISSSFTKKYKIVNIAFRFSEEGFWLFNGSFSVPSVEFAYNRRLIHACLTAIARRLLELKQTAPHLYLSSKKHNIKVSVNDIVIKAVAVALKNVPEANSYWNVETEEIVLFDAIDISIAVATEKGLMTPIVRNADQKSISAISMEVKELAERAGKLAPHEFQGGTFSISNLGMFPVDQFCAIINTPLAGILVVGRGNQVVELVIGRNEIPAVVTKMNLTLSADHRVFEGKRTNSHVLSFQLCVLTSGTYEDCFYNHEESPLTECWSENRNLKILI
ncbi:hypothetical protein CUMW_214620, partial [Citrus unshiu]